MTQTRASNADAQPAFAFSKEAGSRSQVDELCTQCSNPGLDKWEEHFERNGVLIVGRTAVDRATVGLLKMNAADRRRLREQ